jgi:hypothetical protein
VNAFSPAFETLYAGSPGGVVMPCFEPDHVGHENLRPVNGAPQIHAQHARPVLDGTENSAARLNPGVVHQDVDAAESFDDGRVQAADIVDDADIGFESEDVLCAARAHLGDVLHSLRDSIRITVRNADTKSERGEPLRRSETDTRRATRDDGNRVSRQSRMRHVSISLLCAGAGTRAAAIPVKTRVARPRAVHRACVGFLYGAIGGMIAVSADT